MTAPAFSLVIPVLNEAAELSERLSLLQPWRGQGEIIVVDGGSSDESVTLARPLADRVLQSDPGRATQLNLGAGQASGEYLLFLHCDTTPGIAPAGFRELLLARPPWGFFEVRLSGEDWRFRIIERFMSWRSRLTHVATGDQGLFVARELFEALGGFAEIPLMEDVELCKRLRRQGSPCVLTPPVTTSSRRWERRGVMPTILLMWKLRLWYWLGRDPADLARFYRRG